MMLPKDIQMLKRYNVEPHWHKYDCYMALRVAGSQPILFLLLLFKSNKQCKGVIVAAMARYFLKDVASIYFGSLNKDPNLFAALVATQKSIAELQGATI